MQPSRPDPGAGLLLEEVGLNVAQGRLGPGGGGPQRGGVMLGVPT